jgi:hypothetical protein
MELEHVDLPDSRVLSVESDRKSVSFLLNAVLKPQHPRFHPPNQGEVKVYARVRWSWHGEVHWNEGPNLDTRATDAPGESDYGGIDGWWKEGSSYFLEGEWGSVVIGGGRQTVQYLD